jgi:cobyrinic acid a,c-diamide synthase
MDHKVAFVVAGTHSGCGKTTVSLALMTAYQTRGWRVQPFKIGPDFIDPGFHTRITGRSSRNLDGWMLSQSYNQSVFGRRLEQADVAIVEGAMGLYDGYDGLSEAGSSAEMAKWLGLPVILVVDARSMARSAAALVYGFSRFDPALKVTGVIFNRIGSPKHLHYLREAMASSLPEVAVLGGIPREDRIQLPERHLGLVMADEMPLDGQWLESLRQLAEKHLDLNLLAATAKFTDQRLRAPGTASVEPAADELAIDLAVARDAAFCFYYPDNFDWLERAGARLHFFSPLAGETLPPGVAGVYLGGGYPELHAATLAQQQAFLQDIRHAAHDGMPIYAECGGLMVLSRSIITTAGERFPMAGLLPFSTRMLDRRKALGYTEVLVKRPCLLGEAGVKLRGHEFHYSEIVEADAVAPLALAYELHGRHGRPAAREGYQVGSVLASYVHLHLGSAPTAAAHWVDACRRYQQSCHQK